MVLHKKPHRKRSIKTTYTKRRRNSTKKTKNGLYKALIYILIFFVFFCGVSAMVLYFKYIKDLPSTKQLQDLNIAESSIIYDKNGDELYKIFKEKRTYVPFDEINTNMVNALVAGEDKRYWTNPWVDIIGLFRAWVYFVLGKNSSVKGTSTLTQQLIRNTIIKNERSVERKVKEIYLAYKLTNNLSKEKIIELYLNKISYGHNAFGIEEAAKTFFSKKAKDLGILESSILASLPKGPTYYSPYNHPDRILWYPYFYHKDSPEEEVTKIITQKESETHQEILQVFKDFLSNIKGTPVAENRILLCNLNKENFKTDTWYRVRVDSDGCSVVEYSDLLGFLNAIKIEHNDQYIEYQTGRKDFILWRMLEDKYIAFDKWKQSVNTAIGFNFKKQTERISAPHFVFYIKEYLENKYGKDIVSIGWLKIYTTLDPDLQKKAEEIVEKYAAINETRAGAQNASLISLDNKTGWVLAMVWGRDYFDIENKWNVNMTTSAIQPGSTFKPFVYSLWIFNRAIGSKTPIYDLNTRFPGGYRPSNFDGKFMWKIGLSTALNNSRNIPAIKMFYLAGGESTIVKFMEKLWVESIKSHGRYGAPLSLGTAEMSALELAWAYSVFANMWVKKDIQPITKIVDTKGNIIEENTENSGESVISAGQTYIINKMLSDTESRPAFWNTYLSLPGRSVAAKTGTSTKQYVKNGRKVIAARNLWTIWYTPQITTVAWAWNNDGTPLNWKWNGLEGAGPIWKDFMVYAHKGKRAESWKQPGSVTRTNISSISWKLPNPEGAWDQFIVSSLFMKNNLPGEVDNSYRQIEIDALCDGLVSENTPDAAKKKAFILQFHSINPENAQWENTVQEWTKSEKFKEEFWNLTNIRTTVPTEICERTQQDSNIQIATTLENNEVFTPGENTIELGYKSNVAVQEVQIFVDGALSQKIPVNGKTHSSHISKIFIPASKTWKQVQVSIQVIDNQYYSTQISRTVEIQANDNIAPVINITNPIDKSIQLYNEDYFNLRAIIIERSKLNINISIDWENIVENMTQNNIVLAINKEKKLSLWKHTLLIKATDKFGNSSEESVNIDVLEK